MASTIAARRLTETHRLAQARLGAATVRQLFSLFPLLDPTKLDQTAPQWLQAAVPLISRNANASAHLAANYMTVFSRLETGAPAEPALAGTIDVEAVTTSLLVTGPVALKSARGRGELLDRAVDLARARSAAAGMRLALNGGRDTLRSSIERDERALGWARVTSGRPCAFCAMVASRGPVYLSAATASGDDGYHDSCSCTLEPVYDRDTAWPPSSRQWADLWSEAKDDDGDTTANFRRLVESRD